MKYRHIAEMVPVRAAKWRESHGKVVLIMPRFRSRAGKVLLRILKKDNVVRVHLDEVGSAVWLMCDGRRQVRDIAEELHRRFGERVEPLYGRLANFFMTMERQRFIRMK